MTALQIYCLFVLPILILGIGIGSLLVFGAPSRATAAPAASAPADPIREARPRVNPDIRLVG